MSTDGTRRIIYRVLEYPTGKGDGAVVPSLMRMPCTGKDVMSPMMIASIFVTGISFVHYPVVYAKAAFYSSTVHKNNDLLQNKQFVTSTDAPFVNWEHGCLYMKDAYPIKTSSI